MQQQMRAVAKPSPGPGAEIREVKVPEFGLTEALSRSEWPRFAEPICTFMVGTAGRNATFPPPLIPGPRFCDELVSIGNVIASVKEGDFVSAEIHLSPGKMSAMPHCESSRLLEREDHWRGHPWRLRSIRRASGIEYFAIDSATPKESASIVGNATHALAGGNCGETKADIHGRRMYQTWYA